MSFKRFRYSRWSSKLSEQVFLQRTLDLANIAGINEKNSLMAVIEHTSYLVRAHYKDYLKKNDQWYALDDKKVYKGTWMRCIIGRHLFLYIEKRAKWRYWRIYWALINMLESVYEDTHDTKTIELNKWTSKIIS